MSGPKTSQLEIERRIQAQLAALRHDVDHSRSRARRRIVELLEEALAAGAGCPEVEEALAALEDAAEKALDRLATECAFTPAAAMEDSVARAERCAAQAAAIAEAFCAQAVPLLESVKRVASDAKATAGARDFASRLAAAAEESHAEASETARGKTAAEAVGDSAGAPAADDSAVPAERIQAAARRALALVESPYTLAADRALLLDAAPALNEAGAAQLELLLPAMEANARIMADLAALVEDAEEELIGQGVSYPEGHAFATLEEAAAHLETLRALQAQADRNAYLQACIDAVMAAHGYDIARSVRMGRDLAGSHRVFGSAAGDAGIHAFVSDQGDLMLQVAGLPAGIGAVADGATVALDAAAPGPRGDALLQSQHDFCAVYDEIAEDLAAFGITNAVRYKAAPDAAFCRELREADAAADSTAQNARATASRARERRRKRGGAVARAVR
ncbi:hypothetical protein VJ918_07910 [Adlercreutzia sp. R21]|uniref:hypothetical protein n=1 Tax=Adlercreutzia wanghongyangiae TaxID=3111451 RepID=UPI002DBB5871|nr:hypothetical protein [Adlercreutzia sp. R21]MEC4184731.1 hypothetical protein [Adlercreutzia sp. R21]